MTKGKRFKSPKMVVYEKYYENNIQIPILKRCYKIKSFKTLMRLINTAKNNRRLHNL